MDWQDFRYVLEISRAGHLSGAAQQLGVVRTTVGRRLRAMEEALGVRLFDRTPEGFVLTPAGQDLAAVAERLEAEVLAAEGRILGRDAELSGRLRVTMLDFVYEGFLDVFKSFIARYPRVELTVCGTERELSLMRREADVAIRLNNSPPDRLIGRRLGTMHFAPYASRALAERLGEGAGLGAFPWFHQDEREDGRWLDAWLQEHAPDARIAMRFTSYAIMRASIRAEMGVFFLPCFDGDADPELVRVGPRLTEHARDLWLLTLPDLRANSRVRAFMDHVQEAFVDQRDLLAGHKQDDA